MTREQIFKNVIFHSCMVPPVDSPNKLYGLHSMLNVHDFKQVKGAPLLYKCACESYAMLSMSGKLDEMFWLRLDSAVQGSLADFEKINDKDGMTRLFLAKMEFNHAKWPCYKNKEKIRLFYLAPKIFEYRGADPCIPKWKI